MMGKLPLIGAQKLPSQYFSRIRFTAHNFRRNIQNHALLRRPFHVNEQLLALRQFLSAARAKRNKSAAYPLRQSVALNRPIVKSARQNQWILNHAPIMRAQFAPRNSPNVPNPGHSEGGTRGYSYYVLIG
jgi:hypothetical protein